MFVFGMVNNRQAFFKVSFQSDLTHCGYQLLLR